MAMEESKKVVCVTGAGGFIASWIVKQLLEKGYTVHGTVRDPSNNAKCGHLKQLPGAGERLKLFKADVLDYDSIVPAVRGCEAVFHTACPFFWKFDTPDDVLVPAITGTENVMRACSEEKIKRVVMTSSGAAVMFDPDRPEDKVVDERCWTNVDHCRKNERWYLVAKTEAEKTAWKFAEEKGLKLLVVCPVYVFGPLLQQTLNTSSEYLKEVVEGSRNPSPSSYIPLVDVRDVAKAHILAVENEAALGRYFCVALSVSHRDVLKLVKEKFPELRCCAHEGVSETSIGIPHAGRYDGIPPEKIGNKKTTELIGGFIPYEQTLFDTIASIRERGFLP
ncbi:cinnamoyl-CoA reductase 2-like [Selaginella moellendorffii]|uniref:cinnamoyl-CoA reductase 2-like n=1 Tax=Selaginella moellendorffii TaxID=88036 RepID=UPI000D1CCB5C|nr:cinnamoyl-CoA reductase 2-like [Selaginella moellendorffii]|eukprot:XP_024535998.1 cinnamoyl-CoA reductase 2-like [Selaginella moellendorffii]